MWAIPGLNGFVDALPENARNALLSAGSERRFDDGVAVYRRGDDSAALYQVLDGGVRLSNVASDGRESVLGELTPGDCFGEMGLLDGQPRQSDAVASKPTRLLVVGKTQFERLLDAHPRISRELNVLLSRRVRILFDLAEAASLASISQRVAGLLHRLAHTHGAREAAGITVRVSQETLARMLGISRQSVSKELQQLKAGGCLDIGYGSLQLHDLAELERIVASR